MDRTWKGTISCDKKGFLGRIDAAFGEMKFAAGTLYDLQGHISSFHFVQRAENPAPAGTNPYTNEAVGAIMEGTLTVTNWGVTQPLHTDPVTKQQCYPVAGAEAVLKYRIGNLKGNQAMIETVWNPDLTGTVLLGRNATATRVGRDDEQRVWSLTDGVVASSVSVEAVAPTLEARVESIEERLTKAGL